MTGVKRQLLGLGTHAGKKIVREPLEILETATKQVGVKPGQAPSGHEAQLEVKPSIEERRAPRTIRALEAELKDLREIKKQEDLLGKQKEEKIEKEEKAIQKEQKKENFFQRYILKRLQRQVERVKQPQAT